MKISYVGHSPGTLGPSVPLFDLHSKDGEKFLGQAMVKFWPGDGRCVVTINLSDHTIGQRVITTNRKGKSQRTKRRAILDALKKVGA